MNPAPVNKTSDIAPVLSKRFPDIQITVECRFTLKRLHDMIITYSQIKEYPLHKITYSESWSITMYDIAKIHCILKFQNIHVYEGFIASELVTRGIIIENSSPPCC